VGWEAGPWLDHIIVENPQGSKLNIEGIIVIRKGKDPVGFEPTEVGEMTLVCRNDLNHLALPPTRTSRNQQE
jgi:hypothetical protein